MNLAVQSIKSFQRLKGSSVSKYWFASTLPRTVAILGVFMITPLALREFGTIGFGYWTLATFVTSLVVSPDLGLGNSVVNEFTSLRGKGTNLVSHGRRIRGLVVLLGLVAFCWLIIAMTVSGLYSHLIVDQRFSQPTFIALAIGLFCFLSAVPISIVQKIQLALGVANKAAIWEGAGKIAAVILSLGVVLFVPNIYLLIVAYMLPVSLAAWLNGYFFMRRSNIALFGGTVSVREAITANRKTMSSGRWFVVIQISYLFLTSSDLYVVNAVLGPAAVSEVSVTKRPFDLIPVFVSMYAIALWPVFRRIIIGRDHRRLIRFFSFAAGFTGVAAVIGGVFVIVSAPWLFGVISAGMINPQRIVLFSVATLSAMTGIVMIFTNFLNAAATIKAQAITYLIGSLLSVGMKVLGLIFNGVEGFFIFSATSYFIFIFIPLLSVSLFTINKYGKSRAKSGHIPTEQN